MRIAIGDEGWILCDARQPSDPGWEEFQGNEASARTWLERFRRNVAAMAAMRRLFPELSFQLVGNDVVLQKTAQNLASGRWKARRPAHGGGSASSDSQTTDQVGPAFPLQERRNAQHSSSETVQTTDPTSFPHTADLTGIGEALKQAASSRAPFCEECAKAAAATKQ